MISLLKRIFCNKKQNNETVIDNQEDASRIAAGQVWALKDNSPWPDERYKVKIIDVKDGWVRYYINSAFNDERKTKEVFCNIYRRIK